jgi:hypothetical protein
MHNAKCKSAPCIVTFTYRVAGPEDLFQASIDAEKTIRVGAERALYS